MLTHTTLTCVYRFWLIVLILGTNSCAQVVAPPAPAAHPTSAASGVTIASPDPSTPTTPSDGGASTPEKECTLNDGFRSVYSHCILYVLTASQRLSHMREEEGLHNRPDRRWDRRNHRHLLARWPAHPLCESRQEERAQHDT